ncbi:hypothetical protein [Haloferula sp. A504]|uniref:hypothetical protein n=1 Tax=Haloferula sp. A504 TaxID=3373601 RepID=UPI0031BECC69|nr:hypothetical protein [Verrucomicrobiaceae bacterium E54]
MNDHGGPASESGDRPNRKAARVFLVGGMLAFLFIFLLEDGRDLFPEILGSFIRGSFPSGDDAVAVSALFMLSVTSLASPFLLRWLEVSRLLTRLLRWCSIILAASFWFFLVRYGAYAADLLLPLALSPTFTFAGLCLIRPLTPGQSPHP